MGAMCGEARARACAFAPHTPRVAHPTSRIIVARSHLEAQVSCLVPRPERSCPARPRWAALCRALSGVQLPVCPR
eukprot:10850504-Lingulodinium_polyedra.AAC.1